MNVLYFTFLKGEKFAGPTYSVPRQIAAQSKIDNVLWVNFCSASIDEWKQVPYYIELQSKTRDILKKMPVPFDRPDIIVVEQFYDFLNTRVPFELPSLKIPYIIIPRGELTKKAQKRKRIKKTIANFLICRRFAQSAAAIHYLTNQEYLDSGNKWNQNYFICANGVDLPEIDYRHDYKGKIRVVSIGRIEPYQKGLDILVEAVSKVKRDLLECNVKIDIFGPDVDGKVMLLKSNIRNYGLESVISVNDAVFDDEKKEELLNSDLFIMTSRFEGHPMALIEALSFGLPAIVSRGSNMMDEIETYDAGWCFNESSDELAQVFIKLIDEKDKIKDKSKNALMLANNYSWDSIANRSSSYYKSIVGNLK